MHYNVYEATRRCERYRISRTIEPGHPGGPTPALKTLFNDTGTQSARRNSARC